jgi:hypothetical protein
MNAGKSFFSCTIARAQGFAPVKCGVVMRGKLDSLGLPIDSLRIQTVYPDTFIDYRSMGAPPISMSVSASDHHAFMVFDQHLQMSKVRQQGVMNILGCFFDSTGAIADTIPLAIGEIGRVKCQPQVSAGADNRFLVVWQEEGLNVNTAVSVRGAIVTKQ